MSIPTSLALAAAVVATLNFGTAAFYQILARPQDQWSLFISLLQNIFVTIVSFLTVIDLLPAYSGGHCACQQKSCA